MNGDADFQDLLNITLQGIGDDAAQLQRLSIKLQEGHFRKLTDGINRLNESLSSLTESVGRLNKTSWWLVALTVILVVATCVLIYLTHVLATHC